eukprot:ctg_1240.g415
MPRSPLRPHLTSIRPKVLLMGRALPRAAGAGPVGLWRARRLHGGVPQHRQWRSGGRARRRFPAARVRQRTSAGVRVGRGVARRPERCCLLPTHRGGAAPRISAGAAVRAGAQDGPGAAGAARGALPFAVGTPAAAGAADGGDCGVCHLHLGRVAVFRVVGYRVRLPSPSGGTADRPGPVWRSVRGRRGGAV